jgi:hypothetical protein
MSLTGDSDVLGDEVFALYATERNQDGEVVGYSCMVAETNLFQSVNVSFAYDLIYDCSTPATDAAQDIARRLLRLAADAYKITPDGYICNNNPPSSDSLLKNYVLSIQSDPADVVVDDSQCTRAHANGRQENECCVPVQGSMGFTPLGDYDPEELSYYLATALDSGKVTADSAYQTFYLGPEIKRTSAPLAPPTDSPSTKRPTTAPQSMAGATVPAPAPTAGIPVTADDDRGTNSVPVVAAQSPQASSRSSNKLSAVGGLAVAGMALVVVIGGFLLFRRRKRKMNEVNMRKQRGLDLEHDDGVARTAEIDVLSDRPYSPSCGPFSPPRSDVHVDHVEAVFNPPVNFLEDNNRVNPYLREFSNPELNTGSYEYTFDLGDALKSDVMGMHGRGSSYQITGLSPGPTSMAVVPPYPLEETSDSESADSWAQTDGTVGSIEDRLEVITAEI